ncbi:MAG: glycosyltransferase [Nitrospina sp.]|jgi:glycosyltransferase involved in cell wall biosynthesis|nr:glycosyltransferase [Nitrospina sp.]MBT6600941.1 glycosyltransferase [Nitrospina sp.]
MKSSDTIILHDAFAFKGGGERLVLTLCRELEADLAFGYIKKNSFDLNELTGRLIDLKSKSSLPLWRTLKRLQAFYKGTKFLSDYKNVIYSGQNSILAAANHPKGKNIYYCFTPPRSIYDLKNTHLASQPISSKLVHVLYNSLFQLLYENAIHKMDIIVADSKNVQNRIQKFLGLKSTVIYPPCDIENFRWVSQGNYYLSTARLTKYKRVDLIIKAFSKFPEKQLIVSSSGPEESYLKQLAEGFKNIQFTGDVNEKKLQQLIGNAIATIYIPKDEDFGISPVESMAAGKPVIGAGEGGLLETVIHRETGWLTPPDPSPKDLIQAIKKINPKQVLSMRSACEKRAKIFCTKNFINNMRQVIS